MFSEGEPTWQERARERSLAPARRRADEQLTRLLHAAQDLMNEEVDLTVPILVARAGMSTKTFYRHFSGRDDLLLAVLEEELAIGAHYLRKERDAHADPLARLRSCVVAFVGLPTRYRTTAVRQARIRDAARLTAIYPDRARRAREPITVVFREALTDAAAAGLIVVDDVELAARSLLHLISGHIVDAAFAPDPGAPAPLGDHLWGFCAQGLHVDAPT